MRGYVCKNDENSLGTHGLLGSSWSSFLAPGVEAAPDWFKVREGVSGERCTTAEWGGDVAGTRMCAAVAASPPLTSLLIRQVACRLECCIAAEAQPANQERKLHTREDSQVENRISAALSFSQNCRTADRALFVKL